MIELLLKKKLYTLCFVRGDSVQLQKKKTSDFSNIAITIKIEKVKNSKHIYNIHKTQYVFLSTYPVSMSSNFRKHFYFKNVLLHY